MTNFNIPAADPGWHPDPSGAPSLRWFDGTDWTENFAPAPKSQLPPAPKYKWWIPPQRQQPKGQQIEVEGPDTTIHFVLTIVTCGAWLPIWIIAAIVGKRTIKYK